LGRKVEKMQIPMVRGPKIVKFMEDFDQMPYVKNFHVKKTGQVIIGQAHGDHVVKIT